jgi:hypothetical protein
MEVVAFRVNKGGADRSLLFNTLGLNSVESRSSWSDESRVKAEIIEVMCKKD